MPFGLQYDIPYWQYLGVNWASAIRDLQGCGMKLRDIGAAVGAATSTISDIANGRTSAPGGDVALKLHRLHERAMRKAAKQARPRASRSEAPAP